MEGVCSIEPIKQILYTSIAFVSSENSLSVIFIVALTLGIVYFPGENWKGGGYKEIRENREGETRERNLIPGVFYLLCFLKKMFPWSLLRFISTFWNHKVCYPVRDPKNFIVHTSSLWVLDLVWSVFIIPLKNKQKHSPTGKTENLKHELDSFCSFPLSFPWIHNPALSKLNN